MNDTSTGTGEVHFITKDIEPQRDTEEHRWGMGDTVNGRRGVKVQMTKLKVQMNV